MGMCICSCAFMCKLELMWLLFHVYRNRNDHSFAIEIRVLEIRTFNLRLTNLLNLDLDLYLIFLTLFR